MDTLPEPPYPRVSGPAQPKTDPTQKCPSSPTHACCFSIGASHADDIPTSEKEESDFLATVGNKKVLIEEKTKFDDPGYLEQRTRSLDAGRIHASSLPLTRDNRLSGLVKKAASQLKSSANLPHDFRLVWFTATGAQAEAKYHQFIATLYGTTKIFEMNTSHYRSCYFFRNSDFHRHARVLDGAVVAYVSGASITARLCLNPLSPSYAELKASTVAAALGTGIEDPISKKADGIAFILDADIDRQGESALLAYLEKKYATAPLMKFDLGYLSAAIRVSDNAE